MKVTIISTTDEGGAGYAAKNLYLGFLAAGIGVSFLTVRDFQQPSRNPLKRLYNWWLVRKNILDNFKLQQDPPPGYDYFTFARTGYRNIHKHPLVKNADVLNIHWISNMVDYPSFFRKLGKPVIWTLHDTNPFTGGCHYNFGCELFRETCASCKQLSAPVRDFAAKDNLRVKAESLVTLQPARTIVVSPSRWLKSLSEKSALFSRFRHENIPYGIDTDIFKPHDRDAARTKLGILPGQFAVLFVGTSLAEYRKGFDAVLGLKALLADEPGIVFLAAGKAAMPREGIINLGFIAEKDAVAQAYTAADCFLIPSREDNLPNTMLEALCCGCPVIGFAAGGITDAVIHGVNGFTVAKNDLAALKMHILRLKENPELLNREAIAAAAGRKYALLNQAEAYLELANIIR
ncbi:glycosyltransferase [Hufsiella ginkgonis]|uniref:Glycosyltransferase n=1 Tax=Hufsiella ginkgonis TaxID=2695274 RepID=A0A7K1Y2E5_9SPHI|nr:glycosyltransferase [Hufsiella ginkgonis]MXV17454.1 glycosyltransferase [Hufsiella ginkgonis]